MAQKFYLHKIQTSDTAGDLNNKIAQSDIAILSDDEHNYYSNSSISTSAVSIFKDKYNNARYQATFGEPPHLSTIPPNTGGTVGANYKVYPKSARGQFLNPMYVMNNVTGADKYLVSTGSSWHIPRSENTNHQNAFSYMRANIH